MGDGVCHDHPWTHMPRQHAVRPLAQLETHKQTNRHAHILGAVPVTGRIPARSRAGEHGFSEADILVVSIRLPSSLFSSSWML